MVRLEMDGLEELKRGLRSLPEDLAQQAGAIVVAHAEDADQRVERAYPEVTGRLRRGLKVTHESGRYGVLATVRSGAPHAHIFEKGTRRRETATGADRGRMPAAPESQAMIPIIIRVRRNMQAALIRMVQAAGLTVTSS